MHTNASRGKKNAAADDVQPVLLYDVSKDPNETTDLAAQQPERVAKMTAALAAWRSSVGKSLEGADYDAPLQEPAPAAKQQGKKAK